MTNTPTAAKDDLRSTSSSPNSTASTFRDLLLKPRLEPSFGRLEAFVLLVYSVILAFTIPFHEPWADEAQAWLITRDSSLWDLFYRRLHYEGTPGLWHLMLWLPTRLHLPYASGDWISALCAIAGIYVLLRYSPFPTLIRVLLPFTFWLQYQYAVIGRSYSATPLFAFALCAVFCLPRPRAVLFALVAGLMANLSLYAFLWAGALTLLYIPMLWAERSAQRRTQLVGATALLSVLFLFAFYTALPGPDLVSRRDGATVFQRPTPLRNKLIPPTPKPEGWGEIPKHGFALDIVEPPDKALHTRGNALQRSIIELLHPQDPSYRKQTNGHRLQRVIIAFNALFFCVSSSNLLAGAFLLVSFIWLIARGALRFALPLLLMSVLGSMTWINDHHTGLLLVALLCAFWLALQHRPATRKPALLSGAFAILFLVVVLQQIGWSARAVSSEIHGAYDPGIATARFLQQYAAGKRVIGYGYETVSVVPFLPSNPFVNQPRNYWVYSRSVPYGDRLPMELDKRPDFVVGGGTYIRGQLLANQLVPEVPADKSFYAIEPRYLAARGYHEKTRFCGDLFMRAGSAFTYCDIIYTPDPVPQPNSGVR